MEVCNLPVQVIAHTDADGRLKPLRFRYEDDRYRGHTAQVEEVLKSREIPYVGVEAQVFQCRVSEDGAERIYELKYTYRAHKWTLLRQVV